MAQAKRAKLTIALLILTVLAGVVLAVIGVRGVQRTLPEGPGAPVGLMTSLPIYWAEGTDFADFAPSEAALPWTRQALEKDYVLQPMDVLTASDELVDASLPGLEPDESMVPLSELERLAIIQPRGISAQDNVTLDEWVRAGGRLLLVLDPLLTGEYEASIFDPAHPVGSALIPPVVGRWGLELFFDESQPLELRALESRHGLLPVMMAGEVRLLEHGKGQCALDAEGVIARCNIGQGRVTFVADAALFEVYDPGDEGEFLLRSLVRDAFE